MNGYEKREYECINCGTFEVDTKQFSKCKCGANEFRVIYDFSLEYKTGLYNIKKKIYPGNNNTYFRDYKIIEKYAFPFYKMTKPQEKLYNKIKSFEKEIALHVYEDFETLEDGTKQISTINITIEGFDKNIQCNKVNFITYFDKYTNKKKLTKSMLKFYKILSMIKNEELDLNSITSRNKLQELDLHCTKTQKEIYDYDFYC